MDGWMDGWVPSFSMLNQFVHLLSPLLSMQDQHTSNTAFFTLLSLSHTHTLSLSLQDRHRTTLPRSVGTFKTPTTTGKWEDRPVTGGEEHVCTLGRSRVCAWGTFVDAAIEAAEDTGRWQWGWGGAGNAGVAGPATRKDGRRPRRSRGTKKEFIEHSKAPRRPPLVDADYPPPSPV